MTSSLSLTAANFNVLAASTLLVANLIGCWTGGPASDSPNIVGLWRFLMFCEGIFFAMAAVQLRAFQKDVLKSTAGATAQSLIACGGSFFAMSGYNDAYPFLSTTERQQMSMFLVFQSHAAYIGITCFMIGTAVAFSTVLKIPWNFRTPNPKIGTLCFLIGAWTIGLFQLYSAYMANLSTASYVVNSAVEWHSSVGKHAAVVGAAFLTAGASVFLAMEFSDPQSEVDIV